MPILGGDDMETRQIGGSNFSFSAKRIEELGASEYTVCLLIVDVSASVEGFEQDIENTVKHVVQACGDSPRADNLLLRTILFSTDVEELHGFKPLTECNVNDYTGTIRVRSATALFDAAYNGIQSMVEYGRELTENEYDVNGAVYVITDGMDNRSKFTPKMVGEALKSATKTEVLESCVSVLVGVNTDASTGLNTYLEDFKNEAGFTQYIAIGDATPKALARVASFIAESVSSQSQALGTGGPSKPLTF